MDVFVFEIVNNCSGGLAFVPAQNAAVATKMINEDLEGREYIAQWECIGTIEDLKAKILRAQTINYEYVYVE